MFSRLLSRLPRGSQHWGLVLAVLGVLLAPTVALGQEIRARSRFYSAEVPRTTNRAWIGLLVNTLDRSERGPRMLVSSVVAGGPADKAGILQGDIIVLVGGSPASSDAFRALGDRLAPGDDIRLTLWRNDRSEDVVVEMEERPFLISLGRDPVVIRMDSIRKVVQSTYDAALARVSVVTSGTGASQTVTLTLLAKELGGEGQALSKPMIVRIGPPEAQADEPEHLGIAQIMGSRVPFATPLPFQLIVTSSRGSDVLVQEVVVLREQLAENRQASLARQRTLLLVQENQAREKLRRDPELLRIRAVELRLSDEMEKLEGRLVEEGRRRLVSSANLPRITRERARGGETLWRFSTPRATAEDASRYSIHVERNARPLAPYIVGRKFVAGAQITAMKPQLAEYFGVEGGLLVTEVVEGTPASNAGLQSGDVIVRVGEIQMGTVADLRMAISAVHSGLRMMIVRERDEVEVILRD